MSEPIPWDSIRSRSVNLLRSPVINNKRILVGGFGTGVLVAPQNWRKVHNATVSAMYLTYEINSLPVAPVPVYREDLPLLEQQRIANNYYWKSTQYRLEIWTTDDNGAIWVRRSQHPLIKPEGYPESTVDLLKTLNGVPLSFSPGTRVAVVFRDVGFGLPSQSQDTMIVTTVVAHKEMMYNFAPTLPARVTNQITTQLLPVVANTMRLIVPFRIGRKTITFQTSPANQGTSFTIRYGTTTDTTAPSFTAVGSQNLAGIAGYEGEISFSASALAGQGLTVVETF